MQGTEFEASLPFILFGAAGVLVLVVVGWIVRGGFADRRWWKELEEQGVDGTAVVLDVADVSEPHSRTELAFTLRVSLPGMPDREVRKSTLVPIGKERVVREGDVLRVRAHPRDLDFFEIQW